MVYANLSSSERALYGQRVRENRRKREKARQEAKVVAVARRAAQAEALAKSAAREQNNGSPAPAPTWQPWYLLPTADERCQALLDKLDREQPLPTYRKR